MNTGSMICMWICDTDVVIWRTPTCTISRLVGPQTANARTATVINVIILMQLSLSPPQSAEVSHIHNSITVVHALIDMLIFCDVTQHKEIHVHK